MDTDHRRPDAAQARFGIWIGSFGWLIGFLIVGYDAIPDLWPELAGGALVSAAVALAFERWTRAVARPPTGLLLSALAAAMGVLLLYYALVMVPAIFALPELVSRLRSLSPVVEVPVWLGGVLVVGGVLGFSLCRRGAAA